MNEAELRDLVDREWRGALRIGMARDDDDFFDQGGTSTMAASFVRRLRAATGYDLPLAPLLIDGSLAAVKSALLRAADEEKL